MGPKETNDEKEKDVIDRRHTNKKKVSQHWPGLIEYLENVATVV